MAAVLLLAAGSFVLLTAFHPFIFSIFFSYEDKPWLHIQHSLLRPGWRPQEAVVPLATVLAASWAKGREPTGTVCSLLAALEASKHVYVDSARTAQTGHATALSPSPGCWKELRQSPSPHLSLLQVLPAVGSCLPRVTYLPFHQCTQVTWKWRADRAASLPPPCWKGQPFLCSSKFQQRSRTQCHLISNPPTLTARPGNSR